MFKLFNKNETQEEEEALESLDEEYNKRQGKSIILSVGVEQRNYLISHTGANAVIRNEIGKIEAIPIDGFTVSEDVKTLVGSYVTYEKSRATDLEWTGTITKE